MGGVGEGVSRGGLCGSCISEGVVECDRTTAAGKGKVAVMRGEVT